MLWAFSTQPAYPVIIVQPVKTAVFIAETASFSVTLTSPKEAPTVTWYRQGDVDPLVSGSVGTTDSGDYTLTVTDFGGGVYRATLTIAAVELADEGSYYCVATNADGTVNSVAASLIIKRLMAHWPLEGNANDISGNSYHGTAHNGVGYVEGICGSTAADFNGVNQHINAGNVPVMRDGAMSITFWAKPRNVACDWKGIVAKWGASGNTFWIGQHATDGMLNFSTYLPGETRNEVPNVFINGQWSHIVCIFDGQFQNNNGRRNRREYPFCPPEPTHQSGRHPHRSTQC